MPRKMEEGFFWCAGRNKAPEETGEECQNGMHSGEDTGSNPKAWWSGIQASDEHRSRTTRREALGLVGEMRHQCQSCQSCVNGHFAGHMPGTEPSHLDALFMWTVIFMNWLHDWRFNKWESFCSGSLDYLPKTTRLGMVLLEFKSILSRWRVWLLSHQVSASWVGRGHGQRPSYAEVNQAEATEILKCVGPFLSPF